MVEIAPEPPAASEEFGRLVSDLAKSTAPRRFALCEVSPEIPDAWVFAWGLADEDGAFLSVVEERRFGRFDSAERAHRFFSIATDCRLVWVDPTPSDHSAPPS